MALKKPSHISQPMFVRDLLAYHKRLDIAAWLSSTGKPALYLQGKKSYSANPVDDVTQLGRCTDSQVKACIKLFYQIDL